MTVARCTRCATVTRLLVQNLLVAAVPPAADDETVGTVAWICQSCADLSIHSLDRSALLALVAGGAELLGGDPARSRPATPHPMDHTSTEPPTEPTS